MSRNRDRRRVCVSSPRSRRGFTLFELMVVVSLVAITAVVLIPAGRSDDLLRVDAASRILISDLELVQTYTLADPARPMALVIDEDTDGYWIAYSDSPATPIRRPDTGEDYIVVFGSGRAGSASDVEIQRTVGSRTPIHFDSNGGLVNFTLAPELTLTRGDWQAVVTINPATGSASVVTSEVPDPEEIEPSPDIGVGMEGGGGR